MRLGTHAVGFSVVAALALALPFASPAPAQSLFTEPYNTGHGWTYTQTSCGGTCTSGDATGDGNPAPAVFAKITGRSKAMAGYFQKTFTWEQLGVPPGDQVISVDGQWDNKTFQTAVACSSSATAGMRIFDSANTTEITGSAVEPNLNVAGDTAAWANHNPAGAVNISGAYQASGTTVTLRFNLNPATGNNSSAGCEIRGDNYKLSITSTTPSGRNRVIVIAAISAQAESERPQNWIPAFAGMTVARANGSRSREWQSFAGLTVVRGNNSRSRGWRSFEGMAFVRRNESRSRERQSFAGMTVVRGTAF